MDRCQSESDIHLPEPGQAATSPNQNKGPGNFEALRNSSAPNLPTMLTNSGFSEPKSNNAVKSVVKPVPKPRTVFNRRRTAPIHFSCPKPEPQSQPPRRLSQESICFTVLEGLASGENPERVTLDPNDRVTNTANNRVTPTASGRVIPTNSQRQSLEERRLSSSSTVSDSGGLLPPVPPRLNRGVPPAMFPGSTLPSSSGRTDQDQSLSPSSSPCSPCNHDNTGFSGPSPSCSPESGGMMEMVPNEIYCGTLPGSTAPSGRRNHCSQQSVPLPPPRQTLDTTPERNRYVCLIGPIVEAPRMKTYNSH